MKKAWLNLKRSSVSSVKKSSKPIWAMFRTMRLKVCAAFSTSCQTAISPTKWIRVARSKFASQSTVINAKQRSISLAPLNNVLITSMRRNQ
ncbi:hypothetical protein FQZ97_1146740 [compost metagenome]